MRLKNLELQGYKTFASRTQFAFDGGITAIVGPNGSGKSNVADAIRWVLGEQSYRALRGKRTEDMIFSGSALRPRLGMASASLLLDNADGWLPIDFVEVTITRRAYRSGENEYLLNGQRVRLRDITELLAKSGLARRTYTVIGQGLVDAVLSLRADDRRALFEEASGITLYQSKRADALSRLEETRSNLLRVNDIINEIAPRLRRLEREAERAQHHVMLSRQLEGLLRIWYGYRWREEQIALQRSRDALARRETSLQRHREGLESLDEQVARLRMRQSKVREQLGGWRRESNDLHRQMEEVQRDLAVWQERARLLARQNDELETELAALDSQAQVLSERIAASETDVAEALAALREKKGMVAEAQAELDAHVGQRNKISRQIAAAQSRALDLATQVADRRSRLAQLEERRSDLAREGDEHRVAIAAEQARVDESESRLQAVAVELDRLRAERDGLQDQVDRLHAAQETVENQQVELQANVAKARGGVDRLRARYELLSRLREEGEGLYAGVRAVLQAAGGASRPAGDGEPEAGSFLSGIVGTVAQLLLVSEEYEVAIEVALGGHLQDVVVASWAAAQGAIAFLREGQRGRATFLPLDTMRPLPRVDVPAGEGVIGVAADLVRAEDSLWPAVEMLLGRTIVVHDLHAARRIFDQLRGGFQIVTLAGEVLRSSGSVTGGQARQQVEGRVLAREREWRELPARIKTAWQEQRKIERALEGARSEEEQVRGQIVALEARLQEKEEESATILSRYRAQEQELGLAGQQLAWRREQLARLEQEAAKLDRLEESLHTEVAQLVSEKATSDEEVAAWQAKLDQLSGEALYRRLSERRTAEAVAQGVWEHRGATLESLRERYAQLQDQIEAKHQRMGALAEEQDSLAAQIRSKESRASIIQGWLTALDEKINPGEAEVAELEAEREGLEKEEAVLRARLRQAESRHSQAFLAHSRQEDRLQRLRGQITDDFGLVEMEPTEGMPEQPPLPLGELVSALPSIEQLPEGLEEEMHQIKAQLRRMGSVNFGAPDEYAEVLDRYTFLTTQATDLEEAARSLREVIAELDVVMRSEFNATFQEVAARFTQNFAELFGGGAARLVLTDPDDVSQTGVEIVARPPGKRQQTLALLSGGERALTAVALIFSILEVSPPPFCILDEVDAMLDEANVRRFRQSLEALSLQTQFIIITHNRGTIQAADTIYGVSMGDDSVSQVVSLRLDGERIAAPDGSTVEVKTG